MLKFEDFKLMHSGSIYYYKYLGSIRNDQKGFRVGGNWPFHDTKVEKDAFLESVGFTNKGNNSFPEYTSEAQATMLLILAITNYNERQTTARTI